MSVLLSAVTFLRVLALARLLPADDYTETSAPNCKTNNQPLADAALSFLTCSLLLRCRPQPLSTQAAPTWQSRCGTTQ
jgi:hypothetical protein